MNDELFPLNETPQKLGDLFRLFAKLEKVHMMVRAQMQAGARCALAFVHSHWPCADMMEVARGPH